MQTVYKYTLSFEDEIRVQMPRGAVLLRFGNQGEEPVLWALVDKEAASVERILRLAGTGHPLEENYRKKDYVGTEFFKGGRLVFHLFDLGENR